MNNEPFFTMPKRALNLIVKSVERGRIAVAIAVFAALRWLMNNARRPDGPVALTVHEIALHAGVSYGTAESGVGILEEIGLLRVTRRTVPGTKLKAASEYTFTISCGSIPSNCGSSPNQVAESIAEIRKEHKEQKELFPSPRAKDVKGETAGPDPRHHEITSRWGEMFRAAQGCDYALSGRDGVALKRFLKTTRDSADEILTVASAAWQRTKGDPYAKSCKLAATIHGLCTGYNDIRVELNRPAPGASSCSNGSANPYAGRPAPTVIA